MAKKKEKAAAKEETVQAVEGELEDEEVADDNSPGIWMFYVHLHQANELSINVLV